MVPFQTKDLYNQGQYDALSALWENVDERAQFGEWDYTYVMNAFYRQKQYDKCLEVYKGFHKRFPASDRLNDKMGWSLYQTQIKNFDFFHGDRNRFTLQVEYILDHCAMGMYSPVFLVIRTAVNAILDGKMGPEFDLRRGLKYLDKVRPDQLSAAPAEPYTVRDRTVVPGSDRETWYAMKTKLLLKLREYESCLALCDEALQSGLEMHNQNEYWFIYRKVKSMQGLGRGDEGIMYVDQVIRQGMKHWCFYQVLFEIYRDSGRDRDAMRSACACALSDNAHTIRMGFYTDFADWLEGRGDQEHAAMLRHLVILIRESQGWNLQAVHMSWIIPPEIRELDIIAVLEKLTAFWRGELEE